MKGGNIMGLTLRGVKIPHRKNTAGIPAKKIKTPASVTIPMVMHIGAPAKVCVKVGDAVKIGDLIGEQNGFVSSNIYASISGTVKKIGDILLSNGNKVEAVTIESDGLMEEKEGLAPVEINSKEELISAMQNCGLVGLGGAGFPTHVKFAADNDKFKELILNGAECEPYITSDSYNMENHADDIELAINTILKYIPFEKVIIGIENNKKNAIEKMREIAERNDKVSVKVLPPVYPQGGEKVLVYHTTGKVAGEGMLPIDVGCVVCNTTTMQTFGKYLKTGMPLVSKCVTVDGLAVCDGQNLIAPIGTSIRDLIDECGGFRDEPFKILYGGPMMGVTVYSIDSPILKNTNAILALTKKETRDSDMTACIRCGRCSEHCPFGINPAAISNAYNKGELDDCIRLGVNLCMECGCCSYICPARRPLVQNNRIIKAQLKNRKEEK